MADFKCPYMKYESGGFFSSDEYICTKISEGSSKRDVGYDHSRKWCTTYDYRDCPNYKLDSYSSPCFITTAMCDILGMGDDNIYLNLLRKFRNEYLQKNPDGLKLLEEYDFVGPVIAHCLYNDKDNFEVSKGLFVHNIIPVFDDIFEGKNNSAIRKYYDMTKNLIERYNLEALSLSIPGYNYYDYSFDCSQMGHGKLIKK